MTMAGRRKTTEAAYSAMCTYSCKTGKIKSTSSDVFFLSRRTKDLVEQRVDLAAGGEVGPLRPSAARLGVPVARGVALLLSVPWIMEKKKT